MVRKKGRKRWDHIAEERRMVRKYGGNPHRRMGADGSRRGCPLEVKSVRKDNRFRINMGPHRSLVRKNGNYIFVRNGRSKAVPARKVSSLLGRGPWLKDRKYPHKFLAEDKVW